jgi:iron complex transport system substrate-binding protein
MASIASRQPRVASVLPSATEILCLLGGGHLLVGRSHEDNYPASITHLPVLTGQKTTFTTAKDVDAQVSQALKEGQSLYTLDVELLKELSPLDVILTQDLCEVCAIDLVTVERVAKELKPPAPAIVSLNPENL